MQKTYTEMSLQVIVACRDGNTTIAATLRDEHRVMIETLSENYTDTAVDLCMKDVLGKLEAPMVGLTQAKKII